LKPTKRMKHYQKMKQQKRMKSNDICCEDLLLRHQYSRYHRFFIFSPMFLLFAMAVAFFTSRGELPKESYRFLMALVALVTLKEIVGVLVSRRIYNQILKPVEDLKRGLFEVSRGNYGVEVTPGSAPEIAELIHVFNSTSQRLKASEMEKGKYEANRKDLIASISHDLKTPITSINGFIDGILDGVADSPEKQEAYYKIIQQNARYMNRLIDDLLLYSKLDLHKLNFECTSLSINDYVNELFQELELEHEEHGVEMSYQDEMRSPVTLVIDSKLMTRAIRNIVGNAVAYGQKTSARIDFKLSLESGGEWLKLEIKDNGPGIPNEQLEKIFERFYRGDDARTMASGSSGLGLAIAKEIVEAHLGQIWVESELGLGTTIGIRLPLNQEENLCQNQGF
jgi:signal transduction histidine kinase